MTTSTSIAEGFGWLHDSEVLSIRYDVVGAQSSSLTLTIRCLDDIGFESWAGKTIGIVATGVAMLRHEVNTNGHPFDSIFSVRAGISQALQAVLDETRRLGFYAPDVMYSFCFNSGSLLEIACDRVDVSVHP